MEERYAVIGESKDYPILYHMNQQREAAVGQACLIVPMSAWFADPRGALRGRASDDGKDPAAVSLSRKGGLKSGHARAAKMTPEERTASAQKAAAARWGKKGGG